MPAQARTRIERREAKGLGRGGADDLPHVDAHAVEEHLELVDQGDVDAAVGVFEDLGGLGGLAGADRHDGVDGGGVGGDGGGQRVLVVPADDLGDGLGGIILAAGVFALGREGEVEILADLQAALFEYREHDLAGSAGVGGGFQNDELALAQGLGDGGGGGLDIGHVGLALLGQRRGHADDDAVGLAQTVEIGGRGEQTRRDHLTDGLRGDVLDVTFALREGLDLAGVHVEAQHLHAAPRELSDQRQAHVSQPDDAHQRLLGFDFPHKVIAHSCSLAWGLDNDDE